MGSLELLGLNDRVRDGVRNRAKVQLTGDFPPSTPHKRSKVTVGLTLSDSIQTHTSLSCEPSLQQQTSRYATVSLESHWHCTAFQRLVLHIYMSAKALVFNAVASTLGYQAKLAKPEYENNEQEKIMCLCRHLIRVIEAKPEQKHWLCTWNKKRQQQCVDIHHYSDVRLATLIQAECL